LGIYGQNFGYINGFGWAILTAHLFLNKSALNKDNFLTKFAEYYTNWQYPKPIGITSSTHISDSPSDRIMHISDCLNSRNILRTITKSTFNKFFKCLISDFTLHHLDHSIVITFSTDNITSLELIESWLSTIYIRLIIEIEKLSPKKTIYPPSSWDKTNNSIGFTIEFDNDPTYCVNLFESIVTKANLLFPNVGCTYKVY